MEAQAREVLAVVGAGETTFTNVGSRAGIPQQSLNRSLDLLVNKKRVVSADRPLSARPSKNTRYVVADPYLRFWLRFIGPNMEQIERDRGEFVVEEIKNSWTYYQGKAIEPLIREAMERLLPDERFGGARYVGGYWTRTNDVEVDLIGADRERPKKIEFVGSIKWKERTLFDRRDLGHLISQRSKIPGADESTLTVGVSRTGFDLEDLDVKLGPEDLVGAWR